MNQQKWKKDIAAASLKILFSEELRYNTYNWFCIKSMGKIQFGLNYFW